MIELTEQAKTLIDDHFKGKDVEPLRIYLASGCSGPMLALGLDAPGEKDEVHAVSGYDFVVDKELYQEAKPISIGAGPMGFSITSSLKLEEMGGGGCSGCSGCG